MKINVQPDIQEFDYDFMFSAMELMEIIGIKDILGDNLNVDNFKIVKDMVIFNIDNKEELINILIKLTYANKVYNVVVCRNNETISYEIDKNSKKIIRVSHMYRNNHVLLKKTYTLSDNNRHYTFEVFDSSLPKDILINFKSPEDIDDNELISFLLNKPISVVGVIAFIQEYYREINDYKIRTRNDNEYLWYHLKDDNCEPINNNVFCDDVLIKVYKYN